MPENHCGSAPCHTERVVGGTTVVEIHGEIDICTPSQLSARLDSLTGSPRPDVLLDLRSVTFIDCSGLRLLCRARNRALAHGGHLRLVTDSPGFRNMLRATLLTNVFEIHRDIPTALFGTAEMTAAAV
jgi:anti-sigma B factor antagonist